MSEGKKRTTKSSERNTTHQKPSKKQKAEPEQNNSAIQAVWKSVYSHAVESDSVYDLIKSIKDLDSHDQLWEEAIDTDLSENNAIINVSDVVPEWHSEAGVWKEVDKERSRSRKKTSLYSDYDLDIMKRMPVTQELRLKSDAIKEKITKFLAMYKDIMSSVGELYPDIQQIADKEFPRPTNV
jgi:hypothetical protein